jgi:septal ring factor EnvC (AmiA/AmiB activator)
LKSRKKEVLKMFEKKVGKVPIVWLVTGVILLLLLIGLVVEGVVSSRRISATRASVGELETQVEELAVKMEQTEAELRQASNERTQLKGTLESKISDELEGLETEIAGELEDLEERLALQEETTAKFQLQVLLLKASGKALKARIHLAEEEAGLAKRDLRECDATLEAAIALADDDTATSLEELRASMVELREGIEAETFPLTTLEILIDKIEDLIGQ